MANLQLAVKSEYFDAMIRGEKTVNISTEYQSAQHKVKNVQSD